MSNARRVDTATEADWGFLSDPRVVDAMENALYRARREFEDVIEPEDAHQEVLLWIAVRPERVARAQADGDYGQLYQDIYAHALREPLLRASGTAQRTVSRDALEAVEL